MVTDKQIFELPDITLEILKSGVDISFVAQVEGYNLDFQLPITIVSEYLNTNYVIGVSSGVTTPDNASGKNGDIYFKSNGDVYQKISDVWSIKATLPTYTPLPFIEFVIAVGDTLPYNRPLSSAYQNGVNVKVYRCLSGNVREPALDAEPKQIMLNNSTELGNTIQTLRFAGYDDGTGHQMDPPLYVTITAL